MKLQSIVTTYFERQANRLYSGEGLSKMTPWLRVIDCVKRQYAHPLTHRGRLHLQFSGVVLCTILDSAQVMRCYCVAVGDFAARAAVSVTLRTASSSRSTASRSGSLMGVILSTAGRASNWRPTVLRVSRPKSTSGAAPVLSAASRCVLSSCDESPIRRSTDVITCNLRHATSRVNSCCCSHTRPLQNSSYSAAMVCFVNRTGPSLDAAAGAPALQACVPPRVLSAPRPPGVRSNNWRKVSIVMPVSPRCLRFEGDGGAVGARVPSRFCDVIIFAIVSSTVSTTRNRCTYVSLSCPMRSTRPIACRSIAAFSDGSTYAKERQQQTQHCKTLRMHGCESRRRRPRRMMSQSHTGPTSLDDTRPQRAQCLT
eukprot:m.992251 g.992251  ORF g.992251 m.992251 type:complete len:369 (+) comp24005_c0_seq3:194-1300(+)